MSEMKNAEVYLIKGDWLGKVKSLDVYPENEVVFRWFGPEQQIESLNLIFDEANFVQELKDFVEADKPEVLIINVDEGSAEIVSAEDFQKLFGEKEATKR